MEIKNNPGQEIFNNYKIFTEITAPYVGQKHLDFGCGSGITTSFLAEATPNSQVIGYDIDQEKIKFAQQFNRSRNLNFTDSLEFLKQNQFDSISLNFVYHEIDPDTLKQVSELLKPNGKIIVIDYQMKGLSKDEFVKNFNTATEKKEIQDHGLDKIWQDHTQKNVDDCSTDLKNLNFNIIQQSPISEIPRFFKLIAQKNAGEKSL